MQNLTVQSQDSQETIPQHLSIGKTSKLLGVSIDTLRRWEQKGIINSYRSPGGHRYFREDEALKVINKKYERVPQEKTQVETPPSATPIETIESPVANIPQSPPQEEKPQTLASSHIHESTPQIETITIKTARIPERPLFVPSVEESSTIFIPPMTPEVTKETSNPNSKVDQNTSLPIAEPSSRESPSFETVLANVLITIFSLLGIANVIFFYFFFK